MGATPVQHTVRPCREGDCASREVLNQAAKSGHPLHAQDDVEPSQGHDEEVDGEDVVLDHERSTPDDAWARHLFAVGHRGREAWPGLDGEPRAHRRVFGDEVMGRTRVEEGDERGAADGDLNAQSWPW